MKSQPEEQLAWQIEAADLPQPEREYRFDPARKWRFDFCWSDRKLACEVEGGIWSRGRHVRPRGYQGDIEKYNAAALQGWCVLRFTAEMIEGGWALEVLIEKLKEEVK